MVCRLEQANTGCTITDCGFLKGLLVMLARIPPFENIPLVRNLCSHEKFWHFHENFSFSHYSHENMRSAGDQSKRNWSLLI